tara:strand:+ start:3167 stop:3550 length:384 start_codon:yes stop_codon:yes gene_type:complete
MEHVIEVRARYQECDPMGVVHHTVYPVWFEMGRTELLRSVGGSYRELERSGALLAVTRLEVRYRAPARYDDVCSLRTSLVGGSRVKLEHEYELTRDGTTLVTGRTVLACIDREGRPQPLPESIAFDS